MPFKQAISIQTRIWILLLLISGILAAIAYYSFSQHIGGLLAESENAELSYDYSFEQQSSAADNKTLEESLMAELDTNLRIFYIFIATLPLLLVIWFAIKFFKKRKEDNEQNRKFTS